MEIEMSDKCTAIIAGEAHSSVDICLFIHADLDDALTLVGDKRESALRHAYDNEIMCAIPHLAEAEWKEDDLSYDYAKIILKFTNKGDCISQFPMKVEFIDSNFAAYQFEYGNDLYSKIGWYLVGQVTVDL